MVEMLKARIRAGAANGRLGSYRTERRVDVVVLVMTTRRGLPPDAASPGRIRTTFRTERLI